MQGELVENRIIIWDVKKSREIFTDSYYRSEEHTSELQSH